MKVHYESFEGASILDNLLTTRSQPDLDQETRSGGKQRRMKTRQTIRLVALSIILLAIISYSHPAWIPLAQPAHAASPTSVSIYTPNGTSNYTDIGTHHTSITFSVNISSAPSIGGFFVYIVYNATLNKSVLLSPTIDYTGNVLGTSTTVVNKCINNQGTCNGLDSATPGGLGFAVLSLGLAVLGNYSTPNPTNGLLFHITFQTNSSVLGIGQLNLFEAQYTPAGTSTSIDAATYDGYYTNLTCPTTSPTPCRPPNVSIQVTPKVPSQGGIATFNVTAVDKNVGGKITFGHWDWGDASPQQDQNNLTLLMSHTFSKDTFGAVNCVIQGKCIVQLIVHDNEGVVWATTDIVILQKLLVDVTVESIALTVGGTAIADSIFPGALVHISASIRNRGTLPETANMTMLSEQGYLNSSRFRLGFQSQINSTSTLTAIWNTTNLTPRVYAIQVTISDLMTLGCSSGGLCLKGNVNQTYLAKNEPYSTLSETVYVLIKAPEILGAFSLSLLQTTGLGLLVLVGLGFGISRFTKKPSYETEPL